MWFMNKYLPLNSLLSAFGADFVMSVNTTNKFISVSIGLWAN